MVKLAQVSMSSGEISPSMYGRVDLSRYITSLRKCRDFIVRATGGVVNRPGTQLVATAQTPGSGARLIPFIVSENAAYALEFGDLTLAIHANGSTLPDNTQQRTITNVVDEFVGGIPRRTITTASVHGYSIGDQVSIVNVDATGTHRLSNDQWTVLEVPSTTQFRISGSGQPTGSYVSGGYSAILLRLATPYGSGDLYNLSFTQSADVLTITHPDYPVHELRRISDDTFEFVEGTFENGPFQNINTDVTSFVHASGSLGTVSLTATKPIFEAALVGSLFYIEQQDGHEIPPWEPGKRLVGLAGNPAGLLRSSDGKNYRCATNYVVATNEVVTGTIRPTHDYGVEADGAGLAITGGAEKAGVDWEYRDSTFGILEITLYASPTSVAGRVIKQLPYSVVGGVTTAFGPFTMTGDGVDTTLAIGGCTSDNKYEYEVTFNTVIQDPAGYSVNSVSDVLTFAVAPASGVAVSARQLSPNHRTNAWAYAAWSAVAGYPNKVEYYGDRLIFSATRAQPQTNWMSRVGDYRTFIPSVPLVDDDSINITLNARTLNQITDLVPLDDLVILTGRGPWKITAGENDILTPSSIGAKPQSQAGAGALSAIITGTSAIYPNLSKERIYDLNYTIEIDGYISNDISVTAEHLLKNNPALDMAYQEDPLWTIWISRDDGLVASLTYMKEHEVIGWSLHDFGGLVSGICAIPESNKYAVYIVVDREIDGVLTTLIERMADRFPTNPLNGIFLDSAITFYGRNSGTATQTLTEAATGWTVNDPLTLTCDVAYFTSASVGDIVALFQGEFDEVTLRVRIIDYISSTVVTVNALADVPVSFQNAVILNWDYLSTIFGGFEHLVGQTVGVFADGAVLSQEVVDANGMVTIDEPHSRVCIGLPYTPYLETLDMTVSGNQSLMGSAKNIPQVVVQVEETRSIWAGPSREKLEEHVPRNDENYGETPAPTTDSVLISVQCEWNKSGRVVIQQNDPLPITVLSIIPDVRVGGSS
jgi:hypothetical protein